MHDSNQAAATPDVMAPIMRAALGVAFVAILIALPFVIRSPEAAVLGVLSVISFLLVSAPIFMWKDYKVFEPLTLVTLMTVVGCSFKLLYVLAFAGRRDYVDQELLNNGRISVLIYGTTVVTVGLLCFLIGYWRRKHNLTLGSFSLANYESWNSQRVAIVSVIIIAVSFYFLIKFAQAVGVSFLSSETLSQKRFIDFSDQTGRDFREETLQTLDYYYYRIAALAKFAFVLNLALIVQLRKSWFSLHGLLAAWAGLQTIVVFILMNSRASVALVVLDAILIAYLLTPRIQLWRIGIAAGFVGLLILMLLGKRAQEEQSVLQLVEKTFAGRDLMDVTKMSIIIRSVPQQIEYCYGETLLGWMAAPIPKSVWPQKPIWSERGVYVNQRVYGATSSFSGITLGFPAELYWNFGWIGVCVGMLVAGVVLRSLYTVFLEYRNNISAAVIYALVVSRLTIFTLGSDLGTGILKTVLDLIPIVILIFLISQPASEELPRVHV